MTRSAIPAMFGLGALALAGASLIVLAGRTEAEQAPNRLPAPPKDGVMGFVVSEFIPPVIQEPEACPEGPALRVREAYLAGLPPEERARLSEKANEPELTRRWQADVMGPNGTNICSQPDMFSRPAMRTVQSPRARGLDLDGGKPGADNCAHEEFTDPHGQAGVDNQEYRVMGCTLNWRGTDGIKGDIAVGTRQFHASGEWTQVILLTGVDSLENDPDVDVVYANTPDRPLTDSTGRFLPGASFAISVEPPRERNVLKGRIENGVLMTEPKDIRLTQTWGQGGARDIRGYRTRYDYRKGRLRLTFQPDGSLKGYLGGYKPVFELIQSPAIGGVGSALTAGIDCAAILQTARKLADGERDPKTGQCTAVSSAMQMSAVPAFVTDIPAASAKGNAR
jgi:hypothetical protein